MRGLVKLTAGELKRLARYKILAASLATSILWIILFLFISKSEAAEIAPHLIIIDVTAMSVLLIGASHHLEKQEGTLKTIIVTPLSLGQILTAKTLSSIALSIQSVAVTCAALYFIHKITFNYILLLFFILIAGASHAAIAFLLSIRSRDFTTMLALYAGYMFVFTIPSFLFNFGIIQAKFEWLLMLSPTHSSSRLIISAVSGEYDYTLVTIGALYLILLTAALFRLVVYPIFKDNAARG